VKVARRKEAGRIPRGEISVPNGENKAALGAGVIPWEEIGVPNGKNKAALGAGVIPWEEICVPNGKNKAALGAGVNFVTKVKEVCIFGRHRRLHDKGRMVDQRS